MSKFDKNPPRRGFVHTAEAWYANHLAKLTSHHDEIMIGDYPEDGGTGGEFAIRWYQIGEDEAARIEAFSDSFAMLAECKDLLDELAAIDDKELSPQMACEILKRLGFADVTKRRPPIRVAVSSLMGDSL